MNGRGEGHYAVSGNGALFWIAPRSYLNTPVWVDRTGRTEPIDREWVGELLWPSLSPDGSMLAVSRNGVDGRHIWVKRLLDGLPTRVTFDGPNNQPPAWSPDGSRLTFISMGNRAIWRTSSDGSGSPELLLQMDGMSRGRTPSWSADERWLVYRHAVQGVVSSSDIRGLDTETGDVVRLVATEADERRPALSHDGGWMAYESDRSGVLEIYVTPFPAIEEPGRQVSVGGGRDPAWAHNGRELFYVNSTEQLVSVEFTTEPSFGILSRTELFSIKGYAFWPLGDHSYSVSPDDTRFVWLRSLREGVRELSVLVGLTEILAR